MTTGHCHAALTLHPPKRMGGKLKQKGISALRRGFAASPDPRALLSCLKRPVLSSLAFLLTGPGFVGNHRSGRTVKPALSGFAAPSPTAPLPRLSWDPSRSSHSRAWAAASHICYICHIWALMAGESSYQHTIRKSGEASCLPGPAPARAKSLRVARYPYGCLS